jgi:hypothetical protein
MKGVCDPWQGLEPEKARFMSDLPTPSRRRVTWKMVMRFLGGYTEPRWRRDRLPQPLKSRCAVQHFRTHLRREAVTRLRMEGKSFRQIGRELGISQVAAWKLWQQTVEDVIEQVCAEREGQRLLVEACRQIELGEDAPFRSLQRRVVERFGLRALRCFLGPPNEA